MAKQYDAGGRDTCGVHGPMDGSFGIEDEALLRRRAGAEAEAAIVKGEEVIGRVRCEGAVVFRAVALS